MIKTSKLISYFGIAIIGVQSSEGDGDTVIWSQWDQWSECNPDTSTRKRHRQCLGGIEHCQGVLVGQEDCDPPRIWSTWGEWDDCNSSGYRVRSCECIAGPPLCLGKLFQPEACESIWGEWGGWSWCNFWSGLRCRQAPCLSGEPHCRGPLREQEVVWQWPQWEWPRWESKTNTGRIVGYNPNIWRSDQLPDNQN